MNQKREYGFDVLRVISMIMVVVIHVSNIYSRAFGTISNYSFFISLIFNTISRISVPIFLMISGALLLEREFNKTKYLKRLKKYLILIITWDIIYLIWEKLYLGISYSHLYKLIIEPYRAHLWFLYTIIFLYAIQPLLKIILDKLKKQAKIILLLLWVFFSSISFINIKIAQFFTIFSYMGYFIIGKYIYKLTKKKELKKWKGFLIILIILSITGSILLNYYFSIKQQKFYNLFYAYRSPFIMIASISFFILNCIKFEKVEKIERIERILKLSDCSLGVYLIHGIFLDITSKTWNYTQINPLIGIPFFSSFIFISSMGIFFLARKNKYLKKIL